jgi:hypothetical protein
MRHYIIAVGGSGQMVLHMYATWHLAGLIDTPFAAYVFDTDGLSPSLHRLQNFFEDIRAACGAAAGSAIPAIHYQKIGARGIGTVEEILAGATLPPQEGFHHPVQAFFARADRHQDVTKGLYARPALSAVLGLGDSLECLRQVPDQSYFSLVASSIGGTGGGISLPILSWLQHKSGAGHKLRAVFLGRYFQADQAVQEAQDDVFHSNDVFFHQSRRNSVRPLDHFAIVDGPLVQRDRGAEKTMRHWAWPDALHPYWKAASTLHHILLENHRDVGMEEPYECPSMDGPRARKTLVTALGRVEAFLENEVIRRLAQEAFLDAVWGRELPGAVVSYARCLDRRPSEFARAVQEQMARLWSPLAEQDYGLQHVFPREISLPAIPPREIIRCDWLRKPEDLRADELGVQESADRRVASLFLYTLLCRGGQSR